MYVKVNFGSGKHVHHATSLLAPFSLSTNDQERLAHATEVLTPITDVVRKIRALVAVVHRDLAADVPALGEADRRALLWDTDRAVELSSVVLHRSTTAGVVELLPIYSSGAVKKG